MPQRPREHVLEELSDRALVNALPAEWAAEKVDRDYGLDWRVEIFEGGRSTGLMFWVQLKGTDDAPPRSRKVKLDLERLSYWQGLDMPVLVVRYAASEGGRLYWQWTHTIDPHYGRGRKTYTLALPASHAGQEGAAQRLAREVKLFRQARSGDLPAPLPVTLDLPDSLGGARRDELVFRIRRALEATPFLRVRTEAVDELAAPTRVGAEVRVLRDRTVAQLTAGFPTVTVRTSTPHRKRCGCCPVTC